MQDLLREYNIFNQNNNNGLTPIEYAVTHNKYNIVEYILKNFPDNKSWKLYLQTRDVDMVKLLIKHGVEVNVTDENEKLKSPLHFACENDHIDIIDFLLEAGANLNYCDKYGTPMFRIVVGMNPSINVINRLIDAGTDLTITDRNYNILQLCCLFHIDTEIIQKLMTEMNPYVLTDRNQTLMHLYLTFDYDYNFKIKTFEFLLNLGINLSIRDNYGHTVLRIAVHNANGNTTRDFIKTMRMLLEKGCDPYIPDNEGITVFDLENVSRVRRILLHYKILT